MCPQFWDFNRKCWLVEVKQSKLSLCCVFRLFLMLAGAAANFNKKSYREVFVTEAGQSWSKCSFTSLHVPAQCETNAGKNLIRS